MVARILCPLILTLACALALAGPLDGLPSPPCRILADDFEIVHLNDDVVVATASNSTVAGGMLCEAGDDTFLEAALADHGNLTIGIFGQDGQVVYTLSAVVVNVEAMDSHLELELVLPTSWKSTLAAYAVPGLSANRVGDVLQGHQVALDVHVPSSNTEDAEASSQQYTTRSSSDCDWNKETPFSCSGWGCDELASDMGISNCEAAGGCYTTTVEPRCCWIWNRCVEHYNNDEWGWNCFAGYGWASMSSSSESWNVFCDWKERGPKLKFKG